MLVICEDCAKKYDVDENQIKGDRARFSCYECGHIIVVIKPPPADPPEQLEEIEEPEESAFNSMSDEEAMSFIATMDSPDAEPSDNSSAPAKKSGNGLLVTLVFAVLIAGGVAAYMYLK